MECFFRKQFCASHRFVFEKPDEWSREKCDATFQQAESGKAMRREQLQQLMQECDLGAARVAKLRQLPQMGETPIKTIERADPKGPINPENEVQMQRITSNLQKRFDELRTKGQRGEFIMQKFERFIIPGAATPIERANKHVSQESMYKNFRETLVKAAIAKAIVENISEESLYQQWDSECMAYVDAVFGWFFVEREYSPFKGNLLGLKGKMDSDADTDNPYITGILKQNDRDEILHAVGKTVDSKIGFAWKKETKFFKDVAAPFWIEYWVNDKIIRSPDKTTVRTEAEKALASRGIKTSHPDYDLLREQEMVIMKAQHIDEVIRYVEKEVLAIMP